MGTMPSASAGKVAIAARLEADVARVGVDQAGLVEAVTAHHATDCVGDQALASLFHGRHGPLLFGIFGNLGGEFVLEAIGRYKQSVVVLL
jgi:hypothetical protein